MNAMEREARKAELARQVLNIDDDEQLDRIDSLLWEARQEQSVNKVSFPGLQYTVAEMDSILDRTLIDIAEGRGKTIEEADRDFETWLKEEERREVW